MKRLMMAAALLLVALTAQAQDEADADDANRFRVGAAAAFTDYTGDPSVPIEDSGLGVQLYAQAMLTKSFAAEIGYFNSGGFEQDLNPGEADGMTELRLGGFNVSLVGYLPVFKDYDNNIDIYGKVGLYDYDIDVTVVEGNSKIPGSLGHSTGFLIGAGFLLNISENIAIRTGFDWYEISNADLWALGLGIDYQF